MRYYRNEEEQNYFCQAENEKGPGHVAEAKSVEKQLGCFLAAAGTEMGQGQIGRLKIPKWSPAGRPEGRARGLGGRFLAREFQKNRRGAGPWGPGGRQTPGRAGFAGLLGPTRGKLGRLFTGGWSKPPVPQKLGKRLGQPHVPEKLRQRLRIGPEKIKN